MFPLFETIIGGIAVLTAVAAGVYFQRDRANQARLQHLQSELAAAQSDAVTQSTELQALQVALAEQRGRAELNERLQDELAERDQALESARQTIAQLERQQADLKARREELERSFETQRKALKNEFASLSQDILKSRTDEFKKDSQESLGHLLTPLRDQITAFQKRVNEVHQDSSNANSALKNELENLKSLNQRITDEASNLTQALKGDSKTQGNWGEMQVEMILDRSGLLKGQEYERESNHKDEDGANLRPDFIVNLPEGRHLIIDSKVSLVAWSEYVDATTEEEKAVAMKRHVDSINKHIDGLSAKNYPKLKSLNAPDFVLMFMPIEPAFLAAFQAQPELYARAFEKGVIVVVPSTLLGTLRTVANLWSLQKQGENAAEIAAQASKLQDKLRIFLEKFEKVGNQLAQANKTYAEASTSLAGRGGLTTVVKGFRDKGVRFNKELPEIQLDDSASDAEE